MRPTRRGDPHAPVLSILVPMFNEEGNVAALAERIHKALADEPVGYEILFIDDGSSDGSVQEVRKLAATSPRVRLVELLRNFGKEAAMLAGYDSARGDALIIVDADLQQPPELFTQMLALWRQGYDIVDAVRARTEGISPFRRFLSTAFYWVNDRLSGAQVPAHTADFRLVDRSVADVVRQCREVHRFNRALVGWAGGRRASLTYVAADRHAGVSHWGWRKLLQYALDGVLSFSIAPLRLAGWVGGMVSACSFLYLFVVAVLRLVRPELAGANHGYASIVGLITLLGGFQLLAIWLLGEYIGRIYEQVKARPIYLLKSPPAGAESPSRPAPYYQPGDHKEEAA